jgi:hypothetical protein
MPSLFFVQSSVNTYMTEIYNERLQAIIDFFRKRFSKLLRRTGSKSNAPLEPVRTGRLKKSTANLTTAIIPDNREYPMGSGTMDILSAMLHEHLTAQVPYSLRNASAGLLNAAFKA